MDQNQDVAISHQAFKGPILQIWPMSYTRSWMVQIKWHFKRYTEYYVLDTRSPGLKLELNRSKKEFFNINDYVEDAVAGRSISGFVLYVLGLPLSKQSKVQRSVTLLSSETECIALSEAMKEVVFMIQLLQSTILPIRRSLRSNKLKF